jgi:hypothetical protein
MRTSKLNYLPRGLVAAVKVLPIFVITSGLKVWWPGLEHQGLGGRLDRYLQADPLEFWV